MKNNSLYSMKTFMKTLTKKFILIAGALGFISGALVIGNSAKAGNITVKGSDTMVILGQKWAEVYMQKNSGTKVQVTGGGSGIGVAAILNKSTDLANSSRKMKPK